MAKQPHGIINNPALPDRPADYLFRVSLKSIIRNDAREVLVVKEDGRQYWDLPGGGMDHDEDIKSALARELKEEINLDCDFTYRIVNIDEPALLKRYDLWQLRLIMIVEPESLSFSPGVDGDEIAFIHPDTLRDSESEVERRIYGYINSL